MQGVGNLPKLLVKIICARVGVATFFSGMRVCNLYHILKGSLTS